MRRSYSLATYTTLFLSAIFVAFAPEKASAQETAQADSTPRKTVARKFDEYGKVGHCDMTARLDNFAVALMNEPGVRSFIISYDSPEKKYDYADRQNKVARHYLVHERGIDPARITTVNGGQKNIEHVSTELWVVPEGATPPAAPPETDRHTDKNFSGKFDVYATDENVYREMVELGYSGESISHTEFAEKLKQQPDSLGYLVIRASKNSSPGAWRRLARRDERVLQKEYGVESGRLKSIDGGQSDGDYSEVELWVLPKWAPPLAGVVEKIERVPETAFKVSTYDSDGSPGEDAERWVLENLAEALRESPKAHVCIIVREPAELTASNGEDDESAAGESSAAEEQASQLADTQDEAGDETDETEDVELSTKELAEKWKSTLVEKYRIDANRIVVLEGRQMPWGAGRLTTWVVPEKAQRPDPFARDKDEPEDDAQESADAQQNAGGDTAPTAPPR